VRASEIRRVAGVLLRHPGRVEAEFGVRVETALERRLRPPPKYSPVPFTEALVDLEETLGLPLAPYLDDDVLLRTQEHLAVGAHAIPQDSPLPRVHVSDLALGRLVYALCRALRPDIVVETGVAHGQSSALILAALRANDAGALHSVDLPPEPNAAPHVGSLVPPDLRDRWHLHVGRSRQVLPHLLADLGKIDLFLHDSRHTYRNIRRELRSVTPRLTMPGLVIADDVERNSAWARWVADARPAWSTVVQQQGSRAYGAAILGFPCERLR
jgi:predicted O-methyltransferase YrrM